MSGLVHRRVLFLICPTGSWCREDRCQSFFSPELIPTVRPPLEECEAAGALRAAGAEPFVLDAPAAGLADEAVVARLRAIAPDLVVLVTTFGTLDADLAWAARVRAALGAVPIGVRGAPCYVMAEAILARAPAVDFCVRGEYELVFAAIARAGFRAAPGTVSRGGGALASGGPPPLAADLDTLPWPDRSVIDERRYTVRGLGLPQATVRVQRGCPFPCTYCLVHTVSGARARHRSPESVAAEMAAILARGIRHFYLRADTFSVDRAWTLRTCAAIARRAPGARWVTTTRVECVDDAVLGAMRGAGCYGVSFGIDAASAAVGARVRKPPDRARAGAAMRLCDRHGILSLGYFMVGFLWDDAATLAETAAFVRAVRPDLLTVHYAHPYPGTPYHDEVAASRELVVSRRAQAEPALAPAALPAAALRRFARRLRRRHYADPRVLASVARKAGALALDALRGPARRGQIAYRTGLRQPVP